MAGEAGYASPRDTAWRHDELRNLRIQQSQTLFEQDTERCPSRRLTKGFRVEVR